MKIQPSTMLVCGLVSLLWGGCGGRTDSKSSATKLPWSRVKQVEVTTDTNGERQWPDASSKSNNGVAIGPGASQSEVYLAWGLPDHIIDSQSDPDRKIWQYSHSVVVFQGTKVEEVLPR